MRKILVVEDEPLIREAYGIMLSTEPYIVHLAPNGLQALEMCQQNEYDLILLDLMMPEMNGTEFLEAYKKQYKNNNTKIIILSNLSSGKETLDAISKGAHKSVIKANLTPKQLLTMVRYEVEA